MENCRNIFEAIKNHHELGDGTFVPIPAAEATLALPGTWAKVELLRARAEVGAELYHPSDLDIRFCLRNIQPLNIPPELVKKWQKNIKSAKIRHLKRLTLTK